MKVLLFVFFVLMVNLNTKAQLPAFDSSILYKNSFSKPEKKTKPYHHYNYNLNSIPLTENEGPVLKIPEPLLTYKDNTNGFNVYQATPDNMYIIKPDSTVAFNMPVKKSFIQAEPNK